VRHATSEEWSTRMVTNRSRSVNDVSITGANVGATSRVRTSRAYSRATF
jgi:hypothetical protein